MSSPSVAMWVKICGLTTPAAVEAALAAGADAIGFVFAESPRRVTTTLACQLAAPARGRARCVAVTRHPQQNEVEEILAVFRPDALQTDAGDFEHLRLPETLERLPVVRPWRAGDALPPRPLFEGSVSGAGRTCDWGRAAEVARRAQLVLAGGLDAGNVATAIASVRPFGVDVSSGVEARSGVKDPAEINRFVNAARTARAALQEPT